MRRDDGQFPPKERKGSVIEMLALDLAAARAAETKDWRLLGVAGAAYMLLGWGWWYLAEEISILSREEGRRLMEMSVSHKNRRLLRAEARGFARAIQMLERAGVLNERALHEARNAVWLRSKNAACSGLGPWFPPPGAVCAHGVKCDEIGGRCTYSDCPFYDAEQAVPDSVRRKAEALSDRTAARIFKSTNSQSQSGDG
jgi:hypothetical protein